MSEEAKAPGVGLILYPENLAPLMKDGETRRRIIDAVICWFMGEPVQEPENPLEAFALETFKAAQRRNVERYAERVEHAKKAINTRWKKRRQENGSIPEYTRVYPSIREYV